MPHKDVTTLVDKLKTQKGIVIEQKVVQGANHFFDGKVEAAAYFDQRLSRQAAEDRAQAGSVSSGRSARSQRLVLMGRIGDTRRSVREMTHAPC
mgnify:CR=1 FL=1